VKNREAFKNVGDFYCLMEKKELKRIARVVRVLLKNNLGFLIEELGLKLHLPFTKRFLMSRKLPAELAVNLRKSFEELGGAFIKLGQLLGIRPDLVPEEFCVEFKKLLDDVPPVHFDVIKKAIEKSLGKELGSVFKNFEHDPIGSASVAQVHRAKLFNSKDVVVKVLRPGIRDAFNTDISILRLIASRVESRFKDLPVSPSRIVDEFERYTKNELNLVFEARNVERIHKQKRSARIVVPAVYWPATSRKVLTMDFLPGKKLSHVSHPDKSFVKVIIDELIKEIFDYGFFHADLHPGNIIVLPDKRLGLIDFGIVGYIDSKLKMLGISLISAISKKDADAVLRALMKYGSPTKRTDLEKLKQDIYDIINEWYNDDSGEAKATHMMHQLFISCTKQGFVVPQNAVLFGKALVSAEGTCDFIDPDFDFVSYSRQKAAKILARFRSSKAIRNYVLEEAKRAFDTARDIPEQGLNLLQKINSGRFEFSLDDSHFRKIGINISSSSNKLSLAMIITALIIASASLIEFGPFVDGYPVLSIIGLTLAGFLMVPLFFSIIKGPRFPQG